MHPTAPFYILENTYQTRSVWDDSSLQNETWGHRGLHQARFSVSFAVSISGELRGQSLFREKTPGQTSVGLPTLPLMFSEGRFLPPPVTGGQKFEARKLEVVLGLLLPLWTEGTEWTSFGFSIVCCPRTTPLSFLALFNSRPVLKNITPSVIGERFKEGKKKSKKLQFPRKSTIQP